MTKQEFEQFKQSDCPCGKGQVTRHVESTDYAFTTVHVSYSLDCAICRKKWRLEHGSLILIESEIEYKLIQPNLDRIRSNRYNFVKSIVTEYFKNKTFPTKRAELDEITTFGLSDCSYSQYTKYRREGKKPEDIASGFKNETWLRETAISQGKYSELQTIMEEYKQIENEAEPASQKIIRKSIR